MAQRKAISKKMRFEVLKRDKFTCQYCGKQSPSVILHLDHIKPVSKGGKNSLLNLVTSCVDCNLGKGARELSDESELEKQKVHLSALSEKQDQVKMMIDWRESMIDSDELMVTSVVNVINKHLVNWNMSPFSIGDVRSLVCKGSYDQLMESIKSAKVKYGHIKDKDMANEFITKSLKLFNQNQDPVKQKVNYAKGIARNRFNYFDERSFYIKTNFIESVDQAETLIDIVKSSKHWSEFNNRLDEV